MSLSQNPTEFIVIYQDEYKDHFQFEDVKSLPIKYFEEIGMQKYNSEVYEKVKAKNKNLNSIEEMPAAIFQVESGGDGKRDPVEDKEMTVEQFFDKFNKNKLHVTWDPVGGLS